LNQPAFPSKIRRYVYIYYIIYLYISKSFIGVLDMCISNPYIFIRFHFFKISGVANGRDNGLHKGKSKMKNQGDLGRVNGDVWYISIHTKEIPAAFPLPREGGVETGCFINTQLLHAAQPPLIAQPRRPRPPSLIAPYVFMV
jgi:hypothetical protein